MAASHLQQVQSGQGGGNVQEGVSFNYGAHAALRLLLGAIFLGLAAAFVFYKELGHVVSEENRNWTVIGVGGGGAGGVGLLFWCAAGYLVYTGKEAKKASVVNVAAALPHPIASGQPHQLPTQPQQQIPIAPPPALEEPAAVPAPDPEVAAPVVETITEDEMNGVAREILASRNAQQFLGMAEKIERVWDNVPLLQDRLVDHILCKDLLLDAAATEERLIGIYRSLYGRLNEQQKNSLAATSKIFSKIKLIFDIEESSRQGVNLPQIQGKINAVRRVHSPLTWQMFLTPTIIADRQAAAFLIAAQLVEMELAAKDEGFLKTDRHPLVNDICRNIKSFQQPTQVDFAVALFSSRSLLNELNDNIILKPKSFDAFRELLHTAWGFDAGTVQLYVQKAGFTIVPNGQTMRIMPR